MRKKKKLVVCKTKLFFKFDQNGSVFVSGYAWKTGIHPGPKQDQEGQRSDLLLLLLLLLYLTFKNLLDVLKLAVYIT